ncbi:MAG: PilZ domain-containing protein [Proteobacteria bacterium]|nr:PilZ domain-containing protein [Pseudomonadota bacterium]
MNKQNRMFSVAMDGEINQNFNNEKRKSQRFCVKRGQYSVQVWGSGEVIGTIVDINTTGLAFLYPLEALMIEENEKLDIVDSDQNLIIGDIAYKNCYDFEMNEEFYQSSTGNRRRGVQFQKISTIIKSKLENFIRDCANAGCHEYAESGSSLRSN